MSAPVELCVACHALTVLKLVLHDKMVPREAGVMRETTALLFLLPSPRFRWP